MSVITDQGVPAGIMDHPAFLHHSAALPLGVLDGLYDPHQWNIIACWRTKKYLVFVVNTDYYNFKKSYTHYKLIKPF